MTWNDASDSCVAKGGTMLSISNSLRNDWVKNQTTDYVFFGANDIVDEGTFVNIDGTSLTFEQWYPGQPDNYDGVQHCTFTNYGQNGHWDDTDCNQTKYCYACEKSGTPIIR